MTLSVCRFGVPTARAALARVLRVYLYHVKTFLYRLWSRAFESAVFYLSVTRAAEANQVVKGIGILGVIKLVIRDYVMYIHILTRFSAAHTAGLASITVSTSSLSSLGSPVGLTPLVLANSTLPVGILLSSQARTRPFHVSFVLFDERHASSFISRFHRCPLQNINVCFTDGRCDFSSCLLQASEVLSRSKIRTLRSGMGQLSPLHLINCICIKVLVQSIYDGYVTASIFFTEGCRRRFNIMQPLMDKLLFGEIEFSGHDSMQFRRTEKANPCLRCIEERPAPHGHGRVGLSDNVNRPSEVGKSQCLQTSISATQARKVPPVRAA